LANASSSDPTRLLVQKLWAISIKIPVEIAITIDINKLEFELFLNFKADLDMQKYKIMASPPYATACSNLSGEKKLLVVVGNIQGFRLKNSSTAKYKTKTPYQKTAKSNQGRILVIDTLTFIKIYPPLHLYKFFG
jgi:hypothetical protein